MSTNTTRKHRNKAMVAALAAAAALAGGVGVAAAASGPSGGMPVTSQTEGSEQAKGPQQDGADQEEPALNGSIQVQEQAGENERQEATQLAALATVSQAEAEQAALTAVPGTVTSAALGDEDGSLIWEVLVQRPDGSTVEAKVDAGNGTVLAQEADDDGAEGTSEQDDTEENEAGEQGEPGATATG